ncbi:hypothetical protein [Streptomyces sp. A1-5]|uniref:hypothetical protein n=1 Tax=Streptomyces sp. A1-5 TaxID=2738410 RepID=UPI001F43B658|nr:hypothetical protein [Streptomyces sp. A1-5]
MPEIAKKITIKTGKNAGRHPSVASLYRAFADSEPDKARVTGGNARRQRRP